MTIRAPQAPQPLKRGSTNVVTLLGLRDETAEGTATEFPKTAAATVTLRDAAGVDVPGAIGIPMIYVANTERYETKYRGMIDSGVLLPAAKYFAHVIATANGATTRLIIPCPVVD